MALVLLALERLLRLRVVRLRSRRRQSNSRGVGTATHRFRRNGVVVIIEVEALVVVSLVASRGSGERIELSRSVQLRLRLHEGGAVVGHELVAGIGVLAEEDQSAADDNQEQENQGEGCVGDEENNTNDTVDKSRSAEDVGEDEQEHSVEEVHDADGNVERVGALVHPGSENTSRDQSSSLDNDEGNSLNSSTALSKGDDSALNNSIAKNRNNEVVRRCAELDVEETPLVQGLRVGEQDIGRVSVHGDGAASDADHLSSSPAESESHSKEEENSKNNFSRRVDLGELPKTQDGHLRETNEGHAEEDTLQDSKPTVAEFEELLALHPLLSNSQLAESLEGGNTEDSENDEDAEEGQAGHEQVGGLDLRPECDSLDTKDDVAAGRKLNVGSSSDGGHANVNATLRHPGGRHGPIQRSLLNLHGGGRQRVEQSRRGSAGSSLVPSEDILHKLNADDTHRPNKVLSPRLHNGRQMDTGETHNGLGLEVAEEREGVGGDVSGGVGVTKTRNNGGSNQTEASDDSSSPLDANQVDGLSIGNVSLDTSHTVLGVGHVNVDLDGGVEIGDVVSNSGDLADSVFANLEVEVHGDLSCSHGAQTSEVDAAWVDRASHEFVTVDGNSNIEDDAALDGRNGDNVDGGTSVVRGEDDVEQTGRET